MCVCLTKREKAKQRVEERGYFLLFFSAEVITIGRCVLLSLSLFCFRSLDFLFQYLPFKTNSGIIINPCVSFENVHYIYTKNQTFVIVYEKNGNSLSISWLKEVLYWEKQKRIKPFRPNSNSNSTATAPVSFQTKAINNAPSTKREDVHYDFEKHFSTLSIPPSYPTQFIIIIIFLHFFFISVGKKRLYISYELLCPQWRMGCISARQPGHFCCPCLCFRQKITRHVTKGGSICDI